MSIMVATGRGALAGVLIKEAGALEVFERVDTLVLDKTGTLTIGKPRVQDVSTLGDWKEDTVVQLAASLERASEHPLAEAVMAAARDRGLALLPVAEFSSVPGKGVRGQVGGQNVALGNPELFKELGVGMGPLVDRAAGLQSEGKTVVFVSVDGQPAGLLATADPIKDSAVQATRSLRRAGIRILMLTGDSATTAHAVARTLGIDEVKAGVLPDEKGSFIRKLQDSGRHVAMAGDGVNDAPSLAQAEVGIAMGSGTDVAMESAGITLVKGDLQGIVRARKLSRYTMRNIRQNLFFAMVYNILGVPVAAGVLYPFFGVLLSPMLAAAAMTFSSVTVITNALRLKKLAL